MSEGSGGPVREDRLVRLLLRLFPREFRERFGTDLVRTHRDELRALRGRSLLARVRYRMTLPAVLVRDGLLERIAEWRRARPSSGRGAALVAEFLEDGRHAARSLRRRPAFAAAVVMTLGLGVAATTSIFSVFDGVLLRPLPYPAPEELYQLGATFGPSEFDVTSVPNFRELRDGVPGIELVAARSDSRVLMRDGRPRAVTVMAASPGFLAMLGGAPILGRPFDAADEQTGAEPVAIVGDGFWRTVLGGDPGIVGETLVLETTSYTIVGVARAGFQAPEALTDDVHIWLPLQHATESIEDRGQYAFSMLARVPPTLPRERALAALNGVADRLATAYPDDNTFNGHPLRLWMRDLHTQTVGSAGRSLSLLMTAVVVLLLITCANVAGLFLVDALDRERELAVRGALGASRGRLVRERIGQVVWLALPAGALGAALAFAGVRVFRLLGPTDLPRIDAVSVDWRALAFALAIALMSGLAIGIVPALRARSASAAGVLRAGSRGGTDRAGAVVARSALIVTETALALMLVAASGLLLNSLARLNRTDPGFDTTGLLVANLRLGTALSSGAEYAAFARDATERLRGLPGVAAVSSATAAPLHPQAGAWTRLAMEGHEYDESSPRPFVRVTGVGTDYRSTIGATLAAGRDLDVTDRDTDGGVLVNEAFVRAFWPAGGAVGKGVKFGAPESDAPWLPVVGVLHDVRQRTPGQVAEPELYLPFERRPRERLALLVRTRAPLEAITPALRAAIWSIEPGLPLDDIVPMDAQRARTIAGPRLHATLVGTFAALAMLLAAIGLYGLMSFAVARRTRELGIRKALGAARADLFGTILGRGMLLFAAGLALGLAGSLAAGRLLASMLYDVTPSDPATLLAACALLAAAGAIACWLPARRAADVEAVVSLRAD